MPPPAEGLMSGPTPDAVPYPTGRPAADREDDDVEGGGGGDDGAVSSSCTSLSSCSSSSDGAAAAAAAGLGVDASAAGVHIRRLEMRRATAQIGNVTNIHGPLTLVVAGEAKADGAPPLSPPVSLYLDQATKQIIAPVWTTATAAPCASTAVICGSQAALCAESARPEAGPAGTETSAPKSWPELLRLRRPRCAALLLLFAAAAIAAVVALVVLLCLPGSQKIIDLKNGVRLAKRSFWGARPPKVPATKLHTPVQKILINHSGAEFCFDPDQCKDRVLVIQSYHMDLADHLWDDIGYNFLVGGDGVTYEGRGWDAVGAHTKHWNDRSLGVGLIGDFRRQSPSSAQRDQLQRFLAWAVELGKLRADYEVAGACQVKDTDSPGRRFMEELRTWPHWWNYTFSADACKD